VYILVTAHRVVLVEQLIRAVTLGKFQIARTLCDRAIERTRL
jgi:hypothetical protein